MSNLTHLQGKNTKVKIYVKIIRKKIYVGSETGSGSETNWKVGSESEKKIIPDPQQCRYGTTVGSQENKDRKTTITYEVIDPGHGGGGEERGVGHLLPWEHLPGQRVLQTSCKDKESWDPSSSVLGSFVERDMAPSQSFFWVGLAQLA